MTDITVGDKYRVATDMVSHTEKNVSVRVVEVTDSFVSVETHGVGPDELDYPRDEFKQYLQNDDLVTESRIEYQ